MRVICSINIVSNALAYRDRDQLSMGGREILVKTENDSPFPGDLFGFGSRHSSYMEF